MMDKDLDVTKGDGRKPSIDDGRLSSVDLFALIRPELARLEIKLRDVSDVTLPALADIIIRLVGAGGKRLRPAIALLINKLYPADADHSLSLAAAVEMLHTSTLIHDDLIDSATVRRGTPTLNAVWTPAATVFAGNYMFGRASRYAAETEHVRVIQIFAQTLEIIVAGELRQRFKYLHTLPTYSEYLDRIYGKTAALFAAAAEAAAELGAAPAETVVRLRQYGHDLGIAFQIVDDILDFTADEKQLGKPVGADLREGIFTLPVLLYADSEPNAAPLRRLLALPHEDGGAAREQAVGDLVAAVRESPGIAEAQGEARRFVAQAIAALDDLPDHPARQALAVLAEYSVARSV